MTISRNISVMAQGASSSGILAGGYGGLGVSISPTTAGNTIFTTDGSTWSSTQKIVRGTAVATTSGTAVGFTGIPSWVKRITMLLNEVSTSGTSNIMVQIGSGSYTSSGYVGYAGYISGTSGTGGAQQTTNGFTVAALAVSTQTVSATAFLNNITGNVWTYTATSLRNSGTAAQNGVTTMVYVPVTLGGALDRIQLTTPNTTDVFDAGSVNIFYE